MVHHSRNFWMHCARGHVKGRNMILILVQAANSQKFNMGPMQFSENYEGSMMFSTTPSHCIYIDCIDGSFLSSHFPEGFPIAACWGSLFTMAGLCRGPFTTRSHQKSKAREFCSKLLVYAPQTRCYYILRGGMHQAHPAIPKPIRCFQGEKWTEQKFAWH